MTKILVFHFHLFWIFLLQGDFVIFNTLFNDNNTGNMLFVQETRTNRHSSMQTGNIYWSLPAFRSIFHWKALLYFFLHLFTFPLQFGE